MRLLTQSAFIFHRLRPALRGWKPYSTILRSNSSTSSPTRLEGMETMTMNAHLRGGHRLRPALRGWKPRTTKCVFRYPSCLRPALRGWKLPLRYHSTQRALRSPTRLEGMETKNNPKRLNCPHQSPTRLEGMETDEEVTVMEAVGRLRPALRGWKLIGGHGNPAPVHRVSDPP
jgi:hypothetical protein